MILNPTNNLKDCSHNSNSTNSNDNYPELLSEYLSTLKDSLFEGWLAWLIGTLGWDWEQAISELTNRVNWNKGAKCFPVTFSSECFRYYEPDTIVRTYVNEVLKGNIPEYDRLKDSKNVPLIEKHVAEVSGKKIDRVALTLWELYFATKDNSFRTDAFLRPLTAQKYEASRNTPIKGSLQDTTDDIFSTIKTILIILAIVAAAGGGLWLYSNFATVKNTFKRVAK